MKWVKSMQEGWYYYTTNDLDHPDGIKWMDVSITQADLDEMEITLLGPVPAPGTTWTVEEIATFLKKAKHIRGGVPNRFLDTVLEAITDPQDGLAAVTERNRKEQG